MINFLIEIDYSFYIFYFFNKKDKEVIKVGARYYRALGLLGCD
jgi:hypothetical protein